MNTAPLTAADVVGPPRLTAFTCPACGKTSYHPMDLDQGWCGACRDYTGVRREHLDRLTRAALRPVWAWKTAHANLNVTDEEQTMAIVHTTIAYLLATGQLQPADPARVVLAHQYSDGTDALEGAARTDHTVIPESWRYSPNARIIGQLFPMDGMTDMPSL